MRRKANILLVDDQPNNLIALEAMLGDLGHNLVRAESGTKALKALLDEEFALILLDVQMPDMDGFETAALIRERERSRRTPIIFVTALSRSETNVFKGYSLGAVDYLFKPIIPEILRSKVAVFVDLYFKTEEIQEQTQELRRLSRQNQLILNSAAEGVFGVDRAGTSTFVNPAAARMLGCTVPELVGKPIHDIIHPAPACDGKCTVMHALRGEERMEIHDGVFFKSDHTTFPVEFTGSPMLNEQGESLGAVMTFRDVTERREAAQAQENERLYREAQAANRAKDEFLATLSHELRTPMTAILGWVRLLRLGDLDPESFEMAIDAIERSSGVQAQLIEDLLDVSRIVAGKLRLNIGSVDLRQVIERATETVRHTAEEKHIQLVSETDGVVAHMPGDANRLQQVVWNLLTNAIKFTPEGGRVEVTLTAEDGIARIKVKDSGQGINPEFLPFVFDRFRQANSSETRAHGGLGIGLAIVRHLAELHGGTVTAASEGLGKGATFTIVLPLTGVDANEEIVHAPPVTELEQAPADALHDIDVLLVEDDDDLRALVMTILERSGARVRASSSVREAMGLFRERRPEVIVSDLAMPDEDGFALMQQVREVEGDGAHVPLLALTAFGREEDQERVLAAGFARHLRKPIDPNQLVHAVADTVRPRQAVNA
jgi:PAS domain S-box-containing protein